MALLASDHAWLWDRGFEGGGPQLELLRRLAHWLMKEPELEEEALTASGRGPRRVIVAARWQRRTARSTITRPDGGDGGVDLEEISPGRFTAPWDAPEIGLYRLAEGDEKAVVALGPAAPREFEQTIARGEVLGAGERDHVAGCARSGRSARDPPRARGPAGRRARLDRHHAARRLPDRGRLDRPLLPAWLWLLVASALIVGAWLREGRR